MLNVVWVMARFDGDSLLFPVFIIAEEARREESFNGWVSERVVGADFW